MRLFSSSSPSASPRRAGVASSPLLPVSTPPPRASPRSPSSGGGGSGGRASVLRSPPLAGIASSATRDELLALARQGRHLERRLQSQLDAQSAGLLAGLGLADDDTSSQGSRPRSSVGHAASPSPARVRASHHLEADTSDRPLPLPTTRRAIHGTLQELAELKSHEAATLAETLAPLDTFLANVQALEQKKQGLEAAIAKQDSQDARDALQALGDEAESLQKEIQELQDTLATKRARLRHVQAKRDHDASTFEARLSSWRAAAADVDARIKDEVLAGRGLPGRSAAERSRRASSSAEGGGEDVWSLPESRRTLELVREAVSQDRTAVDRQRVAAQREAAAATAGADVWQSAIGAVRGVERVLRREMRRLTSNPTDAAGAGRPSSSSHPLIDSPHRSSPPTSPQPAIALEPLRPASPIAEPDSGTASFATARSHAGSSGSASTILPGQTKTQTPIQPQSHFPGPTTTFDATTVAPRTNVAVAGDMSVSSSPMRTVLAHMDAAIAALAKDVALATDRGWTVLVVAIGAELAALREGRGVLTGAMGSEGPSEEDQGIELDDLPSPREEAAELQRRRQQQQQQRQRSRGSADHTRTATAERVPRATERRQHHESISSSTQHQRRRSALSVSPDTLPTPSPARPVRPYRDDPNDDEGEEDTDDVTTVHPPLVSLARGDTEDDAPSLDLLVESAAEV